MSDYRCKNCGGTLDFSKKTNIAICKYCGNEFKLIEKVLKQENNDIHVCLERLYQNFKNDNIKFVICISFIFSWLCIFLADSFYDNITFLIFWITFLSISYCGTIKLTIDSKFGFEIFSFMGIFSFVGMFVFGFFNTYFILAILPFLMGTLYSIAFLFLRIINIMKLPNTILLKGVEN